MQSLKNMGADCVKVHDRVPREAYFAIAEEARKVGLPLVGHVPLSVRTMEATNAGQRSKDDPRMQYIPAPEKEYWRPEKGMLTRYRTPAYIAYRKREFAKTLEQIPVAHRAGASFLAGTDMWLPYVYPGFSSHDEMALFVRAGLTPAEALRTATINPARFLGLDSRTGSIQRGKTADFVLLDANPLEDIANTNAISAVVANGRLLRRSDLDGMLQAAAAAAR